MDSQCIADISLTHSPGCRPGSVIFEDKTATIKVCEFVAVHPFEIFKGYIIRDLADKPDGPAQRGFLNRYTVDSKTGDGIGVIRNKAARFRSRCFCQLNRNLQCIDTLSGCTSL